LTAIIQLTINQGNNSYYNNNGRSSSNIGRLFIII
jgi:hypothetical protein